MENQPIELLGDVPFTMRVSESKVKNEKRVTLKSKNCIYFRDMVCRAPVCDMDACEKCPEGGAICTRITFIRNMLQKILTALICFIILSELL